MPESKRKKAPVSTSEKAEPGDFVEVDYEFPADDAIECEWRIVPEE